MKTLVLLLAVVAVVHNADARARPEVADFCFLVDITGSMQPYIDGVRDAINTIVDQMGNAQIEQLRLAFVGYRDIGDEEPFQTLPFTQNIAAFKQFLQTVEARGGGDAPEDVFGGLQKVPGLNWNSDAGTRVMFHIADSPCHGKKYHNIWGKHPDGDPKGRSLKTLLNNIRGKHIDYHFGRIAAWRTDKMIAEFSKAWGENIQQLNLEIDTSLAGASRPARRRGGGLFSVLSKAVKFGRKGPKENEPSGPKSKPSGGLSGGLRGLGMSVSGTIELGSSGKGKRIAEASLSALSASFNKAKKRLGSS